MKRPSFFQGALVALLLALAGSAAMLLFTTVLGLDMALRALIAGLAFVYVVYLINRSDERVGRLTALACWLAITGASVLMDFGLLAYLLTQIGMVWLIRSLYFHSSALAALLDLGLHGLAIAAAAWAVIQTGSVLLSLWCFFLVHALFVAIPTRFGSRRNTPTPTTDDQFDRAHRLGEAALRRLLKQ